MAVFVGGFETGPEWGHISETVLGGYIGNTLIVLVSVCALSLLLAIPSAWVVSMYDFPGRKLFAWALGAPLAIPTYVAATVYYDTLNAAIPALIQIRKSFGIDTYLLAEQVLRYGMLAILMSAVLYPYVYLGLRASFSGQQGIFIEAARTLGRGPWSIFWKIALPLARPALVAGLSLIAMEVMNDYGAVNFFGVPTLTEGLFRTWFGLSDQASGIRLAGVMIAIMFVILSVEYYQRGKARYTQSQERAAASAQRKLSRGRATLAVTICMIPLTLGFIIPVARLTYWAILSYSGDEASSSGLLQIGNSLLLSLIVMFAICALALLFAYAWRLHNNRWLRLTTRGATLGYAVPGAAIAIGVMTLLGAIDREFTWLPILSGTLLALGFAYCVRFFTIGFQNIHAGMTQVCGNLDEASRTLGHGPAKTLWHVNLRLLKGPLICAAILVFIDIIKELPLTLVLRPADFETLSTLAFGFAKEGRYLESALPSLIIVLVGLVGLMIMGWFNSGRSEK